MKILAFGASNSKQSMNRQLAIYTAKQFKTADITILNLNDFEMPIYGIDKEIENGIPTEAFKMAEYIDESDLIIISLAEHNGSYTTAFKNILDWVSRISNRKTFGEKKLFLLATSDGKRGAADVLEAAVKRFPFIGGNVLSTFSLPLFSQNFDAKIGITNPAFQNEVIGKNKPCSIQFTKNEHLKIVCSKIFITCYFVCSFKV